MVSERRKVLLVDDEPEILEILRVLVEEGLGYDALVAENGLDALALYKTHPSICCVVSDIRMPEMEGLELLSELRALGYWGSFAFLTGFGDQQKAQAALQLGACDFTLKPFNVKILESTLARLVEKGWNLNSINSSADPLLQKKLARIQGLTLLNHLHKKGV